MLISFGKKIPIATCDIKDINKDKFIKATIVRYDCSDYSDIEEIRDLSSDWKFRKNVASYMGRDYNTKGTSRISPYSFFAMKTQNGETIGYAQTKDSGEDLVLDFLESEPNKKYKYVGTNMISCLSGLALKEKKYKRLYIPNPIREARGFYIKQCGFKEKTRDFTLSLDKQGMKKSLKTSPVDFYA
ncbi:hypothetical protein IKQ26_01785 [bacterium]|nr:hypothetical protein [bacterium]